MIYTNPSKIPLSFAVWLATNTYQAIQDPKAISATSIIKPIREIALTHQQEVPGRTVDIADLLNARMGTAYHDGIENSWKNPELMAVLASLGMPETTQEKIIVNPKPKKLTPNSIPVYVEKRLYTSFKK